MDAATDWVVSGGRYALDLDGTDDFVTCGYSPLFDLASAKTVTAWIYARAFDGAVQVNDIVNTDNTSGVRTWQFIAFDSNNNDTDAALVVYSFGTGGGARDIRSSSEVLGVNRWHFVAFTTPDQLATASEVKLYVDGVQVSTTDVSTGTFGVANTLVAANTLNVGRRPGNGGLDLHFNGLVDCTMLFNRVLSSAEIRLLATRRGIAYERSKRRTVFFDAAFFNPAWARNSNVILSPVGAA